MSCREAEAGLDKKTGTSRTEPQQDSRVSSPVFQIMPVREVGKMDE